MTSLRAVLFDVDGTLLDRTATLDAYLEGHMDRLTLPESERNAYRKRYLELDADGHGNRRVLASILAREFTPWVRPAALRADFERHAWTAPRPAPGAERTLRELHALGVRVGALTNGLRAAQHAKLHRAGLRHLLDVIVVGTPRGPRKPDPAVFLRATRELDVDVTACLMIGDHPEQDIHGARHAGLRAAWYARGRAWPEHLTPRPDVTFEDLRDLPAYVREVAAGNAAVRSSTAESAARSDQSA